MRIAIFAALPQEYRPFQQLTSNWRRISRQPVPVFRRYSGDKECFLVETGMGNPGIAEALRLALDWQPLDLILSIGFAGSLGEDLRVGRVVLATGFATAGIPLPVPLPSRLRLDPSPRLQEFCREHRIAKAQLVTVRRPQAKTLLRKEVGNIPAIVDMETTLAAQAAWHRGIPFLCLRAISDGPGDDIDWDLDLVTDGHGRVRMGRAALALLEQPSLIGSFWTLWRNARQAAYQLAPVLAALVELDAAELSALVRNSQLTPAPGPGGPPRANGENPPGGCE
jgi:adenosylhomocysteine nucleosidase